MIFDTLTRPFHMPLGSISEAEPVFVVGAGRSGTTLLQLSLNVHSKLAIFGETQSFFRYQKHRQLSQEYHFRRFLEDWRLILKNRSSYPEMLDEPALQKRLRQAQSYAEVIHQIMEEFAHRESKERWGEKTPAHIHRMREITQAFPRARFIHIVRDPRAMALSSIRAFQKRHEQNLWHVFHLTRYWLECQKHWQKSALYLAENQRLRIRYEDLVSQPEPVLRKICDFLAVDFEPTLLSHQRNSDKYLPKQADGAVVRRQQFTEKGFTVSRVDRWRKILTPHQIALIEAMAGQTMEDLDYTLVGEPFPQTRLLALHTVGLSKSLKQFMKKHGQPLYWAGQNLIHS